MTALLLFVLALQTQIAAPPALQVKVQFSSTANLVYQLDCISGSLAKCSSDAYLALWKQEFLQSDKDRELVKSWGQLSKRYHRSLAIGGDEQRARRFEGIGLDTKLRIASFQAQSPSDYFTRLDLVIAPKAHRQEFQRIIENFSPRFDAWWKRVALPKGKPFVTAIETILSNKSTAGSLAAFAKFYAVALPPGYVLSFNFMFRPPAAGSTNGQQIENYSVSEFVASEPPIERMQVVMHELCHFFLSATADKDMAGLQAAFDRYGKLEARGAYVLLNETLATALGNGVFARGTLGSAKWEAYEKDPLSFYADPHIDKASKAILPWMEVWLTSGKTLFDPRFVPEYVALLEKNLGKELSAPHLLLGEMHVIADGKFETSFGQEVGSAIRASSSYYSQGDWSDDRLLQSYWNLSELSALFIVHPSNLASLKDKKILQAAQWEQLRAAQAKTQQAIFAFERSPGVAAYIIVAPNFAKAVILLKSLAAQQVGFVGVMSQTTR